MPVGGARAGLFGGGVAIPDSVTNQWPVDEGSGSTLTDAKGSVDATLNGGTWTADSSAVGGYVASLDGVDDDIHIPDDAEIRVGSSDFTWTQVISQTSVSGVEAIVWAYNAGGGNPQFWGRFEESEARLRFLADDGTGTNPILVYNSLLTDGNRHLIAFRRDGNEFALNVDGTTVDTLTASLGDISGSTTDGIYVGAQSMSNDLHAELDEDEFALYNGTALTDSELSNLADHYGVS